MTKAEEKRIREEKRKIRVAFKMYHVWKSECAERIADAAFRITANAKPRGGKSSIRSLHGFDFDVLSVLSCNCFVWCKVVEETIKYYTERHYNEMLKLIEMKYFEGKEPWEIAMELHIGRTTVFRYDDDVIAKAREFGIKHRIIEP